MKNRTGIQEIPGALRVTLEHARAEYGATARNVRWGDGPIYVCARRECSGWGQAAAYAFESLLGWPVVARPVEVLQSYGLPLLRPRAILLLISSGEEWPETLELANLARRRGCTVIGLTHSSDHALSNAVDHSFMIRAEVGLDSRAMTACLHAALNFLAFEVARALKRPEPYWQTMAEEFGSLPDKLEWVFIQLASVVDSVAAEVARLPRLRLVGGGFYDFPAREAARRMASPSGPQVEAVEATEFCNLSSHFERPLSATLFLSGSHSKLKKLVAHCAAQAQAHGAKVISLTDSNDRDLTRISDIGILIPSLFEVPGSTLSLFIMEWLSREMMRLRSHPSASK